MAVAGDPFLAPRCNTDLILVAIRQQLFHHRGAGRQNVVAFQEAFTAWDGDGDQRLSHFEFERALGRCGIFLPVQEVNALFRRFDVNGDGHADAQQALSALRVPLSKRRLAMVDAAFSAVAAGHATDGLTATDGLASDRKEADAGWEEVTVPLSEALDRMNPDGHAEVAAGRLSAEEVKDDFCEFFISRAGASAKKAGGGDGGDGGAVAALASVTMEGFREYYRDVGVCEPYDTVFVPMMEAVWGVQEPQAAGDKQQSELTRLLRPKLLQHSHHAETTSEVFKKSLRYYSLDSGGDEAARHGGMVNALGVERALNGFGLYPDKRAITDIFTTIGSSHAGPEEVDKVVAYLCPPEPPMAPMF